MSQNQPREPRTQRFAPTARHGGTSDLVTSHADAEWTLHELSRLAGELETDDPRLTELLEALDIAPDMEEIVEYPPYEGEDSSPWLALDGDRVVRCTSRYEARTFDGGQTFDYGDDLIMDDEPATPKDISPTVESTALLRRLGVDPDLEAAA